VNGGNIKVSGNHVLENIKNTDTGKLMAEERKFVLLDLATFGNLVNAKGSTMSMTGDNSIKKLENKEGANFHFKDHSKGHASKVEHAVNHGNVSVSGNHVFGKVENNANWASLARTFDKKGNAVKLLLI
jgi:hypothetical protein